MRRASVVGDDAAVVSAGEGVEYRWRVGGMGLEAIDVLRTAS